MSATKKTTTQVTRHFERWLSGKTNAGVRARIRSIVEAADSDLPGVDIESAILALAHSVAFTARGRALLAACAADYRNAQDEIRIQRNA